jgi:hypothetical protein
MTGSGTPSRAAAHVGSTDRYVPTHVDALTWSVVESTVNTAVTAATSAAAARARYRTHAAAFAGWAYRETGDTAINHFRYDLIERYIEVGMPGAKDSTRATRRSILRRIARRAHPLLSVSPDPKPIAYRRVRAPYAAHEVASYFRLAEAQPTAGRRDSLMAILVLGLGCGLDCGDLGWVRGVDVRETDNGVDVAVGGRRPRVVTCLSWHEDRLITLAASAADDLLIGGTQQGRRNVTSVTLGRLLQDNSVPPLVVARLRSTWLTAHLAANTPLPVVMRAAGLRTVRPLEDLLDPAPAYSGAEASRALRSAG